MASKKKVTGGKRPQNLRRTLGSSAPIWAATAS